MKAFRNNSKRFFNLEKQYSRLISVLLGDFQTLTKAGDISSIFPIKSVKNSVMSFCSPVFKGCLSMVYVRQNDLGLYAFRSLA